MLRLAQAEAGLSLALRHKLRGGRKTTGSPQPGPRRTLKQLFAAAERIKREAAEKKAVEAERRRIADLKKLAAREEPAWQAVEALLERCNASAYKQAITQLKQLRELADYKKKRAEFDARVRALRERYKSRTAFVRHLVRVGLV